MCDSTLFHIRRKRNISLKTYRTQAADDIQAFTLICLRKRGIMCYRGGVNHCFLRKEQNKERMISSINTAKENAK